jgi:hypothetical protein
MNYWPRTRARLSLASSSEHGAGGVGNLRWALAVPITRSLRPRYSPSIAVRGGWWLGTRGPRGACEGRAARRLMAYMTWPVTRTRIQCLFKLKTSQPATWSLLELEPGVVLELLADASLRLHTCTLHILPPGLCLEVLMRLSYPHAGAVMWPGLLTCFSTQPSRGGSP